MFEKHISRADFENGFRKLINGLNNGEYDPKSSKEWITDTSGSILIGDFEVRFSNLDHQNYGVFNVDETFHHPLLFVRVNREKNNNPYLEIEIKSEKNNVRFTALKGRIKLGLFSSKHHATINYETSYLNMFF